MQVKNNFKVVRTTDSKGKNGISSMHIETSIKGFIYRCEAYMDSHLIDAVEVNCSDLSSADRPEDIFAARYNVAHRKFEELYTQERFYSKVLSAEGDYLDGEGHCHVTTSISDNVILCEAFLDGNQIDQKIEEIDKAQASDGKIFKVKYTQAHKEFISKYIKILKFPANTFLNPVLKKYPMYKKSPMYALGFFLASIVLAIWIISMIICGKAMKKIVAGVAGKQAGMVFKEIQKTMCTKSEGELEDGEQLIKGTDGSIVKMTTSDTGEVSLIPMQGPQADDFVVLPQTVVFKDANQVYPVYIKNNLNSDVVIRLKNRVIFDFVDALVSPDMIVNVLTDSALHINSGDIGVFEFKLENEFLQSPTLEERIYHGSIILEATNVQTKVPQSITINFDFTVKKEG